MGTGLFETGSLSRFPQGTHHEQQGNAIRNSNEGTNVERIVSSVNEGDIDRGVGEGNDARDFEETQGVSQGLLRSKSIKNIVTLNPKIKEDPLYKGTFLNNLPHLTKPNQSKNIEFIIHPSSRRGEYVSLILATMSRIDDKWLTYRPQRCLRCSGRNPTVELVQTLNQFLLAPTKYLLKTQSLAKKYIPLFAVSLLPRRRRAIPYACKFLPIIDTCNHGY